MTKRTVVAKTVFGEFTRASVREYRFAVVRADGWHQFSISRESAEKELRFQQGRGRNVVMVPVEVVNR